MAVKVLQVVGATAVVIIVVLLIPILLRLRRTLDDVAVIVAETRPQTVTLLRKAQSTLDNVNRELVNVENITEDTNVLIGKVQDASNAVEKAIRSPMSKVGFVTAGAAAATIAVKRRLVKDLASRE